jgi:hypothetical protein
MIEIMHRRSVINIGTLNALDIEWQVNDILNNELVHLNNGVK